MNENEVGAMLKRMQFVETCFANYTSGWVRKFVRLVAQNNNWFIGHYSSYGSNKLTPINIEDVNDWIKYFDRI